MQTGLNKIDGDNEEGAKVPDLDDCFGGLVFDREATDDELDFSRLTVALALDNFAGKDDVFEIEDRKVVIVEFFRSME